MQTRYLAVTGVRISNVPPEHNASPLVFFLLAVSRPFGGIGGEARSALLVVRPVGLGSGRGRNDTLSVFPIPN